MLGKHFWTDDARAKVEAAVRAVESQTSVEVVVAVRPSSGTYRHTDYLVGGFVAMTVLCVFLYHPEPFDWTYLPLEVLASALFGVLVSAWFDPLRRLLTSRTLMSDNATARARSFFVEQQLSRTRDRTGVLVFLSVFERRVVVVCDIGVDEAALGTAFADAKRKLERAVGGFGGGVDAFVPALLSLGPIFAGALPRRADDVNELPDAVGT